MVVGNNVGRGGVCLVFVVLVFCSFRLVIKSEN